MFGNKENIIKDIKSMDHTILLMENGKVYAKGLNNRGQLGIVSNNGTENQFHLIDNIPKIEKIDIGLNHTIFLTQKNELYVCGDNSHNQLGLGLLSDSDSESNYLKTPKKIDSSLYNNETIKHVCCGHNQTYILTENYSIYACGLNDFGQLGIGHYGNSKNDTFEKVNHYQNKIRLLRAGGDHCMVLTGNSELFGWGRNVFNQLMLGIDIMDQSKPTIIKFKKKEIKDIQLGYNTSLILTNDGTLFQFGNDKNHIFFNHSVRKIFPFKGSHQIVQLNNNKIASWGCNSFNQIDQQRKERYLKYPIIMNIEYEMIKTVFCGAYQTFLLLKKKDEMINIMGRNYLSTKKQIDSIFF